MRQRCRVWWPKESSVTQIPVSESLLFGWFVTSSSPSDSVDVVVAFLFSESSDSLLNLQATIHETNEKMPVLLQNKSAFSLLGCVSSDLGSNGQLSSAEIEEDDSKFSPSENVKLGNNSAMYGNKFDRRVNQWHEIDELIGDNWIQLVWDCNNNLGRETFWIPKLNHVRLNGQRVSTCDVHFVLYESPAYGTHHFSSHFRDTFELEKAPTRKPKWVEELHHKKPQCDMVTIILAINSATASRLLFRKRLVSKRFFPWCFAFMWNLFAISVASFFTLLYIILQSLYKVLSYASSSWIYITSTKVSSTVGLNIQIHCSQILYWPIVLQDRGIRSLSCVEFEEKAGFQRHLMWSSLVTDVLLGNLIGFTLWIYAESVSLWILNFTNGVTNELLRSGCVWLMGVPAGFKLNTELAGVIGMLSLNVIQIWSTLWVFVGFRVIFFIRALAILGIVFGATIPAALVVDFLALATLHVSTIHRCISVLYSTQIQAIASLWRLFRGQKWNPLRKRLDSYDYTVKQHVVGSLLFTPLLLLLPTTSVFYIFFSILDTTINLICVLIGIVISIIHATPYVKIYLRLVRPRRFPSGIWFDIVTCFDNPRNVSDEVNRSSDTIQSRKETGEDKYSYMVSFLRSNFMTLGQVVSPDYKSVFLNVSRSTISASAYGVLTGKRIGSTFVTGLPSPLPWMFIPCREYWLLCRDSIVECFRT